MITFADHAFENEIDLVNAIPRGYTVALLDTGQEPTEGDIAPGVDVSFQGADEDGVRYFPLDADGEEDTSKPLRRCWDRIARIHVY